MTFIPRDYQAAAVESALAGFAGNQALLGVAATGLGKCLKKDTPVLMYSGNVTMVQDIVPGDLLMGPDSAPRTVTSICSGREMMYRVTPTKGNSYEVNESHVLSLKITGMNVKRIADANSQHYGSGDIANIDIRTYLASSSTFKHCAKGYRAGVSFPAGKRSLRIPPYILGVWLGDGSTKVPHVTTMEPEVIAALQSYCDQVGLIFRRGEQEGKAYTYHMVGKKHGDNHFVRELDHYGLRDNKTIPHNYLVACEGERLELLAGLIDTDGFYADGCYDFVTVNRDLADGIEFLARSLGFAVCMKPCRKCCTNSPTKAVGTYYRGAISGDLSRIPCIVPRRIAPPRQQKKDVLVTGIKVEPVGIGDYYGFTLAGNDRRFLLGDFTVTHNTAIAGLIARHYADKGRILWLTHEDQLLKQSQRALEAITGLTSQVEKAEQWADAKIFGSGLLFSTVQTMIAGRDGGRMTRFDPRDFSLLINDESHHSPAPSWRKVIAHFMQNEALHVLGLTATPDRTDEQTLAQIFHEVAFEYDINYGLDNGWLVPIEQLPVYVDGLDLSGVRTTAGELNGSDLARVLEEDKVLYGMATPILDSCGDEKTLVFTQRVEQAKRFADILNSSKPHSAEYICGTTPIEYRDLIYKRYANGDFQYLVNVGITIEGFDNPGIRYIAMCRPHRSRSAYAQKCGRGLRPLPGIVDGLDAPEARIQAILDSGKPALTILDFYGNAGKHPLIHVGDVLGGKYPDEVVELAQRNMEQTGKPANVATELQRAEREFARRQQEAMAAAARSAIQVRSIYHFGKSIDPFVALDIVPRREPPWHKGRLATEGQRAALEKFGVNAPDNMSFVHAGQALDALIKRAKEGKPSLKQARLLKRFGFEPEQMTFAQAKQAIDKLAANNWRRTA